MASTPRAEQASPTDLNESDLFREVLGLGLATQGEIDGCRALQERLSRKDDYKPILQVMVAQRVLTPNQAQRLLQTVGNGTKMREPPGYRLLDCIGRGSMGTVFRADQLSMDRTVALKVLQRHLAINKEFIERFHREARIAAKLSHNNIVQAIDSGECGGQHYFVMEYVDGTNINESLGEGKVYDENEALKIIVQIAEALAHANDKGLIHRDIKPENIMLTKDGTAKLADLGLARLTADDTLAQAEKGIAVGTPYYISPEQIRGEIDVDIRADIYSLGATLYHMVTGRVPFPGKTRTEVMHKHLRARMAPPDHLNTHLTGGLGEMVETMMAKDREARYSSPEDLIIDLKNLMEGKAPVLTTGSCAVSAIAKLAEDDGTEGTASGLQNIEKLSSLLDNTQNQLSTSRITIAILIVLLVISVIFNFNLAFVQR
jgi:serine/threonine-protein kinase